MRKLMPLCLLLASCGQGQTVEPPASYEATIEYCTRITDGWLRGESQDSLFKREDQRQLDRGVTLYQLTEMTRACVFFRAGSHDTLQRLVAQGRIE